MNQEAAARTLSGLHKDNRALRLALVVLVVANVILVFAQVFRSQIVTIIPSNSMVKSTYTATSADEGALSSWGMYVAELLGNVTPATADFTADSLGHILAPSIYKQVMAGVADQVAKIKADQLTLRFDMAAVKFNAAKRAVYVSGWLSTTDSHGSQQRQERTFEIYFDVVNYQPRVIGLQSYDGAPRM